MAPYSAAELARPTALEATVTTVTIPGLGLPDGMFVLGDGTRLFSSGHAILQLTPSGIYRAGLQCGGCGLRQPHHSLSDKGGRRRQHTGWWQVGR